MRQGGVLEIGQNWKMTSIMYLDESPMDRLGGSNVFLVILFR